MRTSNTRKPKPQSYTTLFLAGFEPPGYEPDQSPRLAQVDVAGHPITVAAGHGGNRGVELHVHRQPTATQSLAHGLVSAAQSEVEANEGPQVLSDEAQTDLNTLEVIGAAQVLNVDASAVLDDVEGIAESEEPDELLDSAVCASWPSIEMGALAPQGSETARIRENLDILRLSKQIEERGVDANDEERTQLLRYAGWGGMAQIFEATFNGSAERAALHKELKSIVSEQEWAFMRGSTPNAHYTDPDVIDVMWSMLRRAGFNGGRIVEPAAGTGLILAGMPTDVARASEITAVELDKVSGTILRQAFNPLGVQVHVCGLERARLPDAYYDLVVGNVPFGDYQVPDTRRKPYSDWSIHNWFTARAVEMVRPGGLVCLLTSSYLMDAKATTVRRWLDIHAELVHAVRLPEGAFRRHAKTDVVVDLIVLKRRESPSFDGASEWAKPLANAPRECFGPGETLDVPSYRGSGQMTEKPRPISPWFAAKPNCIIGELGFRSTQYGGTVVRPIFKGTQEQLLTRLRKCVQDMPEGVYEPQAMPDDVPPELVHRVEASHESRVGQFVLDGGRIFVSEGETWLDVDSMFKGKHRARVLGLMALRDATREVIECQRTSDDDVELAALQVTLNRIYDAFVKEHGCISEKMNVRAFRADPDFPLLLGLEEFDENTLTARKTDIFDRRTINQRRSVSRCDTVKDAMLVALNECGKVHIKRMAQLTRKAEATVRRELTRENLAFKDPQNGQWVTADEYLSGFIAAKLAVAQAAGPAYARNVAALTQVLPKPLGPGEIHVRLGAPWLDNAVIEQFVRETMELDARQSEAVAVTYDPTGAVWSVRDPYGNVRYAQGTLAASTWGTSDRNFYQLIEAALNQQPPTITTRIDDKDVVDRTRTLAAREKYEAIKTYFGQWVYQDEQRRDEVVAAYNARFNQVVARRFDGSHLQVPGLSSVYTPFPQQLNAAWRIVTTGNTLLAHCVGAGKSLTMMIAAMELRRLGKAKKPLHAVPNNMLLQYTSEFLRAFPGAKVLMATSEDLVGDKRREFCARIAMGDWDSIVMTHATFERLACRPETTLKVVGEALERTRMALDLANEKGAKRSVKELEKRLKTLEAKLSKAVDASRKDSLVYFDDLGVDTLFVDELHLFKNLMRISKMPRVAGLPNTASMRAFDLLVKAGVLRSLFGGKEEGFIGATATPIANSMAEMHVMQRFVQPKTLEDFGLLEFDAWAATFGESVTGMEIAPDGSGYRMNTRFARFVNVAELMAIFRMRADVQTAAMLKLPTPAVAGGKPTVVQVESSPWLKAFTQDLVERADKVRSGQVEPKVDNMLKITHEGRIAALDERLVDARFPGNASGKLAAVVRECMRIYAQTAARKGAQIIFCDLGTPGRARVWNVYEQVRSDLIDLGVPPQEIAFIHDYDSDAAKAKLFKEVREGKVRFMFGSTIKMGVGTNAQTLLKAVHQIDAPWRPCDVTQRDGRGLRMGNTWEEIELLRYVTRGSFDSYMWQTLEIKANFIEQVMSGDTTLRAVEDIGMTALSYAEIKAIASGNPLVLEKATIDAEVLKYTTLRDHWQQERWHASNSVRAGEERLQEWQATMPSLKLAEEALRKALAKPLVFRPAKGAVGEAAEKYAETAGRIGGAVAKASALGEKLGDLRLGNVAGCELNMLIGMHGRRWVQVVMADAAETFRLEITHVRDIEQNGQRVLAFLHELQTSTQDRENRMALLREEVRRKRHFHEAPFEYAEKLAQLLERQTAILASLDLDKETAGAAMADEGAEKPRSAANDEDGCEAEAA